MAPTSDIRANQAAKPSMQPAKQPSQAKHKALPSQGIHKEDLDFCMPLP
jgi:hypothetical protein